MKKNFLVAFVVVAVLFSREKVNAQIALENMYDSAANHFYMVNLEIEGYKYIWRDNSSRNVRLYNLNHSVFKVMPYPSGTFSPSNPPSVLYVSEHLFNTDDFIEYMFVYNTPPPIQYNTRIVNETGNLVFAVDFAAPLVMINAPQEQQPIYNTPNGTKMILSLQNAGSAHVYSLPGTLTNAIEPLGFEDMAQLKAFPNPNNGNATIEFKLPHGISSGEIVLYKMDGAEVKRYTVDGTFGNLILNNSGLSSGTYMYQLIAGNKALDAKRMIIIH